MIHLRLFQHLSPQNSFFLSYWLSHNKYCFKRLQKAEMKTSNFSNARKSKRLHRDFCQTFLTPVSYRILKKDKLELLKMQIGDFDATAVMITDKAENELVV